MSRRFVTPNATYIEIEQLGQRPAVTTYRVQRESDGETFVLKELRLGWMKEWSHFELFEREIATLKSVVHPKIPRFIESHLDEEAGTFLAVQTYLPGRTLRQVVRSSGIIGPERTESYLRQGLQVLDYLHSCSPPVIHRDISPSNVVVHEDELFVIDFGAVKVGTFDTTAMTTAGTFGYMAPEQILGRAGPQSDLYGLGMTFVSMVTGREPNELPQDAKTGQIDARSVLQGPPHLRRTLLAMINPGVAGRPRTARDALTLLDPNWRPPAQAAAPRSGQLARPIIQPGPLSPYRAPLALSERDKAFMKRHTLRTFPAWAAVLLHYFTFGLFSIFHFGLQHDRFPQAMPSDPSGGKAVGFSFIPYFNLYWCVFAPLRLADRINLQTQIRGQGDGVDRSLILACSVLGVIPYLNILLGFPLWGAGVYNLQTAINRLARQAQQAREAERAAETQRALESGSEIEDEF